METKIDYNKRQRKLNSDLERYQIIVDYFNENRERVESNQNLLKFLKDSLRYSETINPLARKEACLRTDISDFLEAEKWSKILKCS